MIPKKATAIIILSNIKVLGEQEKGMVERIKQLEQQGTQTTLDPKEVAKLEKVVKENQKGTG